MLSRSEFMELMEDELTAYGGTFVFERVGENEYTATYIDPDNNINGYGAAASLGAACQTLAEDLDWGRV